MPRRGILDRDVLLLGRPVPVVIAGVGLAILALSVLSGVLVQLGSLLLLQALSLIPGAVLSGELWRLLTWILIERDALSLVLALFMFWLFGVDLVRAWGGLRFVSTFAVLMAAAGLLTTLLSLVWRSLLGIPQLGPWPLVAALVIAWACLFPQRQIFLYFVLPLRGRALIVLTLLGTLLSALIGDARAVVPHFLAALLTLLYMRQTPFGELWLSVRRRWAEYSWRRSTRHLRVVHKDDDRPGMLH